MQRRPLVVDMFPDEPPPYFQIYIAEHEGIVEREIADTLNRIRALLAHNHSAGKA